VKVKISILWIIMGFVLTLVFTLKDFDPSTAGLQHMLTLLPPQQLSPYLLGDAAIRLAPFFFAFLSVILKDTWNRLTNLVLGFVFTVAGVYGLVGPMSQLSYATSYLLLTQAATIATAVLIFWYAYRWPKKESKILTPAYAVASTSKS